MKKILFLAFLLPFTACKKNATMPTPTPDITESLSLSIVNQNPDKYDSVRGHVSDSFSWSIPNANGTFAPSNATTLILESLIYGYGTGNAIVGDTWLSVNDETVFNTIGLTIGFPADTANLSLGYPYTDFSGGTITFADTVAANRTYGIGLSRMLNWWRGDAIPVNDSVTNYVDINTNSLELIAQDTLVLTSKAYIGGELVVSGTFSEKLYSALAFTYGGSFCLKSWYVKGTFSNMIYMFRPD